MLKFLLPLKDILNYGTADMFFAQRQTGLPAEKSRSDVVLRWRRDKLLKKCEITQEELLQYIPVDSGQHRPVVGLRAHCQQTLNVPQGLKQVEHVPPVAVEELAHERGACPCGGQEQYVLVAVPVADIREI